MDPGMLDVDVETWEVHGSSWMFMDVNGYQWMVMDVGHGKTWLNFNMLEHG